MADLGSIYVYGPAGASVNKPDVMDAINNVDPYDTPLLNLAPKVPISHSTTEWLEDTLTATSTGGRVEGQAFTQDNIATGTRVTNVTQIFGKHVLVSETQQAVSPYGFTDTFLYEIMKGTREVMRNIESRLFAASGASASGAGTAGTAGTARAMKNLNDFITSNLFMVNSTAIGGADVASGASASSLNEPELNGALQLTWENGGNPNWIFTAGPGKRTISSFSGSMIAGAASPTAFVDAGSEQIGRAVNSYLSDFGLLNVALDRWVPKGGTGTNRNGVLFGLELPRVQIGFLRPMRFERLAKDGDRVRGMVIAEGTLRLLNQKAHLLIFGIRAT